MSDEHPESVIGEPLPPATTLPFPPKSGSIAGRTGRNHHRVGNGQIAEPANEHPERLAALKEIFAIEAAKNDALPIGGGLWVPAVHPVDRVAPPYTEWDGTEVGSGTVPISAPLLFSANDCLDIGRAYGGPVSRAYAERTPFEFEGRIDTVRIAYTLPTEAG